MKPRLPRRPSSAPAATVQNPAPNTEVDLPGLGTLTLNEQYIDHTMFVSDPTAEGGYRYAEVIYVFGAHLRLEQEAQDTLRRGRHRPRIHELRSARAAEPERAQAPPDQHLSNWVRWHPTSTVNFPTSGALTFLFTDIEGSTRKAHELGENWFEVLETHHEVLRPVFAAHGGIEVSTAGDSFFVVFEDAADADQRDGRHAARAWPRTTGRRTRRSRCGWACTPAWPASATTTTPD